MATKASEAAGAAGPGETAGAGGPGEAAGAGGPGEAAGAPAALAGPGSHEVCPFCRSTALVVPSRRLRYVCAVCGRARVPVDDPALRRSGREVQALDDATRAERTAQLWRGLGVLAAFFGAATALVFLSFLILVHPPLGAALLSGAFALAPSAGAFLALRRSRQAAGRVEPALERGWDAAAADLVAQRPSVTEAELAAALRLAPAQAEAMLVRLSAEGLVGSQLTDAGELTFHPTGRARLAAGLGDSPPPPAAGSRDELEAAFDEAEALDEAARAAGRDRAGRQP